MYTCNTVTFSEVTLNYDIKGSYHEKFCCRISLDFVFILQMYAANFRLKQLLF